MGDRKHGCQSGIDAGYTSLLFPCGSNGRRHIKRSLERDGSHIAFDQEFTNDRIHAGSERGEDWLATALTMQTLSWLPVDLAAAACIEISSSSAATDPGVWHILNSSTATTWETVHAALRQAGIEFDVIPRRQWVAKLRDSDSNLERNPTYKLVDFFAAKASLLRRAVLTAV